MVALPQVEQIPFSTEDRFYSGDRTGRVTLRDRSGRWPLNARSYLQNYSDTFAWGRDSPGAAQLSLALLADALADDARAERLHEAFKRRVAVDLPERWTISRSRIRAHARMLEVLEAHRAWERDHR